MKIFYHVCLQLALCAMLFSQSALDQDGIISKLLSGRKNPGDQEVVAALGIESLDILLDRLLKERDQNKLPVYAHLIGTKYRQFSAELSSDKKDQILNALTARIDEIKDVPPTSYLIHSSLNSLQGINHTAVLKLIDKYSRSEVEWTRASARRLSESMPTPPPAINLFPQAAKESASKAAASMPTTAAQSTPAPPMATPVQKQTPSPTVASETKPAPSGFPVAAVVIIAAVIVGILVFLLRRKSS